uniref:Thioredoxin domain-containing protein n=1 Tax=Globodera pallida TaxID=36090 RepID=A0A183C600_GLOPA
MAAQRLLGALGKVGVGLTAAGVLVQGALYNVDAGQRAVIFDRFSGVKPDVIGEGTHFLIPWVQRPIMFDIRAMPRAVNTVTGSKDLQNVSITLRILHRPDPVKLPQIYLNIGIDYAERVLPSITNEILKAVVAQFDAHEMITQRESVSHRVSVELAERAKQFGFILDDISITHLSFGREFTEAVEMKQVAQQEAEKARYLVEKAEQMKLAAITTAEGDAQASTLLAQAFSQVGDGLIELRKLEAAEEIAEMLSKSKNVREQADGEPLIDFDEINRSVEDELAKAKQGKPTELEKSFMNFRMKKEQESLKSSTFITWKAVAVLKENEMERNRQMAIGKARLGGEWELVNVAGKAEGSKDFLGKWVLIYFGFTNCPDICPDEIEKMIDVVDILNREEANIPISPVFISVDPERDTAERVRVYCAEFSPKLCGFTGDKEQVAKVTKAFRVYHSEGPRTKRTDDYIVDHTVIMYLIDPDGNFHDYYGQNRRAREIVNVIKIKAMEWEAKKRKEQFWLNKLFGGVDGEEQKKEAAAVTTKAMA